MMDGICGRNMGPPFTLIIWSVNNWFHCGIWQLVGMNSCVFAPDKRRTTLRNLPLKQLHICGRFGYLRVKLIEQNLNPFFIIRGKTISNIQDECSRDRDARFSGLRDTEQGEYNQRSTRHDSVYFENGCKLTGQLRRLSWQQWHFGVKPTELAV